MNFFEFRPSFPESSLVEFTPSSSSASWAMFSESDVAIIVFSQLPPRVGADVIIKSGT